MICYKGVMIALCSVWCLMVPEITAAQGNFYLTATGGLSLGFVKNYGVGFTLPGYKGESSIGTGYKAEAGVGYTLRNKPLNVEFSLGTYNMTNPTNPQLIGLKLKKLSFTHRFYSAALQGGYRLNSSKKRYTIEGIAGLSYLFNRPMETFSGEWLSPGPSAWYFPEDLYDARYNARETITRQHVLLVGAGLRLTYKVAKNLNLRGQLSYERSFSTMRSVLYSSERRYNTNQDLDYQVLSVFSGDALGLKIGLSYSL